METVFCLSDIFLLKVFFVESFMKYRYLEFDPQFLNFKLCTVSIWGWYEPLQEKKKKLTPLKEMLLWMNN